MQPAATLQLYVSSHRTVLFCVTESLCVGRIRQQATNHMTVNNEMVQLRGGIQTYSPGHPPSLFTCVGIPLTTATIYANLYKAIYR